MRGALVDLQRRVLDQLARRTPGGTPNSCSRVDRKGRCARLAPSKIDGSYIARSSSEAATAIGMVLAVRGCPRRAPSRASAVGRGDRLDPRRLEVRRSRSRSLSSASAVGKGDRLDPRRLTVRRSRSRSLSSASAVGKGDRLDPRRLEVRRGRSRSLSVECDGHRRWQTRAGQPRARRPPVAAGSRRPGSPPG